MITTHVIMSCDSDESFEQLKTLSAALLDVVRAEPGCIASYFAVDVLEPRTLHGVARYRDEAALTAHIREPATQRYMAAVSGLGRVATNGFKYEVSSQTPLLGGAAGDAFNELTAQSS